MTRNECIMFYDYKAIIDALFILNIKHEDGSVSLDLLTNDNSYRISQYLQGLNN